MMTIISYTKHCKAALLFSFVIILLSSCGGKKNNDSPSTNTDLPEPSYCSESKSFADSISLTGKAQYYYRSSGIVSDGVSSKFVLTGNPIAADISFAEIQILNSNGEIIQCGLTQEDGTFSIPLPKGVGNVLLKILSRSLSSKIKISILEDITANQPYSIQTYVNMNSSDASIGIITASARQSESSKIEGGAFHIMKMIYQGNKYIRDQIANQNWVADKVTVYWKAGLNPYSYFGYPDNPLSFYRPGESKLYVLGGYNGDVSKSDTDHFDSAIILHEYAHFLEDIYGKTDSPGGYHNGDFVIDPRLAWSEGFANFFQAAVLGKNYYADTSGFCNDSVESGSCTQNVYFKTNASGDKTVTTGSYKCVFDCSTESGEGNFRELSVTRTLYKLISTASSTAPLGAGIPFKEIWNIFSNGTTGYHSPGQVLRSINLLNSQISQIINSNYSSQVTYWNSIANDEKQERSFKDYGNSLFEGTVSSCSNSELSPVIDSTLCVESNCPLYKRSNQLRSNDFYKIDITQTDIDNNATISIDYTQSNSSYPVDLDLYLYKQNYTYFEEYMEREGGQQSPYISKRSSRTYGQLESGNESISLSQLTPGTYLLNIKANTYGKTSNGSASVGVKALYRIKKTNLSSMRYLCPST